MPLPLSLVAEGWYSDAPDPVSFTFHEKTYFTYITAAGGIYVASYDHASGETSTPVELISGITAPNGNNHNTSAVIVRASDRRVVVAYCPEGTTQVRVRISTNPEDASSFGSEIPASNVGLYTYVSLTQHVAEPGAPIYMWIKYHAPDEMAYAKSLDGGATFTAFTRAIKPVLASGDSLYWRVGTNWRDRTDIFVTTTNRFASNPSAVHHVAFGSDVFSGSDGTPISSSLPFSANLGTLIQDASVGSVRPDGSAVDADDRPACLMMINEANADTNNLVRLARWTGSAWALHPVASIGAIAFGAAIKRDDPFTLYIPIKVGAKLEVHRFTSADEGETWSEVAITAGSSVDQYSPETPWNATALQLLWTSGTFVNQDNFNFEIIGWVEQPRVSTLVTDHIEAWVTTPAGNYIAHLDRSEDSPFRAFAFHRERNAPGGGSLEYHLDNAIITANPTIFAKGNLVHMRYRNRERVWVVRDNGSELGQDEHAGDWVKVSGPGVWPDRRLVFPTGFADGANLNPATWASQWRSFANRAAGELLWDCLSESNPRFATAFVRGTVQTTEADGMTIDYRFEDIGDDVIPAVLAARGGEVEFDGLTFNYYNPGRGTDRSGSVIFEEGADLLSLRVASSRPEDSVTWVVGEGVGEGVFAKLAISDAVAADRREGFYAAKEAGNLPLLQLLTTAARDEHDDDTEALAVEVDESRYRVLLDYDLADTVRVISPSRGVDRSVRIEAVYVKEDGDRVRVAFDVGVVRDDPELAIETALRKTRSQLGVRNRQPQGQLVPFNFNGNGVIDSDQPAIVDFLISNRIYVTIEAEALFSFSEFWAAARAASSGGGATSGASSASSSASGGSSTPTSGDGGSSTPTSGASSASTSGASSLVNTGTAEPGTGANSVNGDPHVHAVLLHAHTADHTHGIDHTHSVTIGAHTHSVTIGAHTHGIEHNHTTPAHTHGLDYGIFKEAMPATHSVNVGVYKRVGTAWTLIVSLSGLTADTVELDLSQYIDGPGSWRLAVQSAAAQPNNGRLAVSVSGQVIGAIRSS